MVGTGDCGQLGLGDLESKEVPILIEALAGIKVRSSVVTYFLINCLDFF